MRKGLTTVLALVLVLMISFQASSALNNIYPSNIYTVLKGDSLYLISKKYHITISSLKSANELKTNTIRVGQKLFIPPQKITGSYLTYSVVRGDTLTKIAVKYKVKIDTIKSINNLINPSIILVGQKIYIPNTQNSQVAANVSRGGSRTSFPYTVQRGDTVWNVALKFGASPYELAEMNHITINDWLNLGQTLTIPVHNVPVKPTVGPRYGELLDWWTEAQYVFPLGAKATVEDLVTGKRFNIVRSFGYSHADNEPLTAADAAMMKEIWGGSYSWKVRAVIVIINGRRLAASASSMHHSIENIGAQNNFPGHFDIHFLNSRRHKDDLIDETHQAQIRVAAGLKSI